MGTLRTCFKINTIEISVFSSSSFDLIIRLVICVKHSLNHQWSKHSIHFQIFDMFKCQNEMSQCMRCTRVSRKFIGHTASTLFVNRLETFQFQVLYIFRFKQKWLIYLVLYSLVVLCLQLPLPFNGKLFYSSVTEAKALSC